jgi:hypothetical protein
MANVEDAISGLVVVAEATGKGRPRMSETPTARELLDRVECGDGAQVVGWLAARVEVVLALKPMESDGSFAAGSAWMLKEVRRVLDGGKP